MLVASMVIGFAATPAFAKSQPAAMKKIIREVAKSKNLKEADIKALFTLCKRESDFDPKCVTGSCKGLFQMQTHHKEVFQPRYNTGLALAYIKKRYKTPRKALAHSYRYGWY
jgi:hypothetical protein